jgi:hypothetical protein
MLTTGLLKIFAIQAFTSPVIARKAKKLYANGF